ncbi:MAG: hypothetical protein J6U24_03530 [Paludibacteraceae bacterium]|nr:hypothetical protein [Paludibacteraceae bacterium]
MKKSVFSIIILAVMTITASAADITIVDNQPMQPVAGMNGWYSYTISQLSDGDSFNMIFNNGGWAGGQTADYYVESAGAQLCFTSNGTDSAISEIQCPTTEAEELALTSEDSVYSNSGRIYGSANGVVAIYSTSGACMQVIDAEGAFESRQLPNGFYIVKTPTLNVKILTTHK